MTWLYIQSEPQLWTVGFYDPKGNWHAESDYPVKEWAANRVHYLNGGESKISPKEAIAAAEGKERNE